jgi:hypothetical protein
MPTINPYVKDAIFYGAFLLLFVLYGVIVGGALFGRSDWSGETMVAIASMAPIILEQLSLAGEAGPFVLGAVMAWTAPRRTSNVQTVLIILLSGLLWLAYLHMQVFFDQDRRAIEVLQGTALEGDEAILSSQKTLSSFAASVRTFAAVIMAAILGLRFNDNVPAFQGAAEPPAEPAAAGVASEPAVRGEAQ